MNHIKKYKYFVESLKIDTSLLDYNFTDMFESLTIFQDNLLRSIKAEELDIFKLFKAKFIDISNIDTLVNSNTFIESLSNIGLKKSEVQNSDDYQTFISKSIKFMSVYDIDANDLMNPKFLLIQTWNETLNKWNDVKVFKVNDDMKKFYDKLGSKTIEIESGDNKYIYKTSNSGNNWELQNLQEESEIFKRFLNKEELQNIIKGKEIKLTII